MGCKNNKYCDWLNPIINEAGYDFSPLDLGFKHKENGEVISVIDMLMEINKYI